MNHPNITICFHGNKNENRNIIIVREIHPPIMKRRWSFVFILKCSLCNTILNVDHQDLTFYNKDPLITTFEEIEFKKTKNKRKRRQ